MFVMISLIQCSIPLIFREDTTRPDLKLERPAEQRQQQQIACVEQRSRGRALAAVQRNALRPRARAQVIYTSPLKALSNQKFKEFSEDFGAGEVGLMTGDVTLNAGAACLVMTTEILRSMLFLGSDVVREVRLLVFDEIHYIRVRLVAAVGHIVPRATVQQTYAPVS